MRFNDDGRTNSKIDELFFGAKRKNSGSGKFFTTMFDNEWHRLSPENARPLTAVRENFKENFKLKENFNFKDTDGWVESAQLILLPFHGFADEHSLVVDFKRKLSDTVNLSIKWVVWYPHLQSGNAGLYAADLLAIKRKVYEQGAEPKNSLESISKPI